MNPVLRAQMDAADWRAVKSSTVRRIAYVEDFASLFVEFKSGGTYRYSKVPRSVYEAFLASASKGRFVYYELRGKGTDSVYAVERV